MWVCLNDGFLSIVEVREDPGMLQVRARKRSHLEAFQGTYRPVIHHTPDRDYHWRFAVPANTVAEMLKQRVLSINYSNFKNSVRDNDLHIIYERWWWDLYSRYGGGSAHGPPT